MTQSPHTPENWDAASAHYDANFSDFTAQYAGAALEAVELGDGSRVLEVAAGGGALTLELAPRCGSLLAVDYSAGMLDQLRPKLDAAGLDHVELQQMDGMALDVADESFDHAFCQFAVMLFDDPARGLAELCRVVAPGGSVVVTAWAGPDRFESFGVFMEAIGRALPDLPRPDGPPPIFSLANVDVFNSMLRDAGFAEARVDHVTRTWTTRNAEEFVEVFKVSAPPSRALLQAVGPDNAARLEQAMHDVLVERFGNGPVEMSNTATMGVARR